LPTAERGKRTGIPPNKRGVMQLQKVSTS
jgi:hypothetical protein